MALALLPFGNGANVRILIQALTRSPSSFQITGSGTIYSFAGKVESYSEEYQVHDADLTPMDTFTDNPVPYGQTQTYTITELQSYANSAAGSQLNVIRQLLSTSFYAAIVTQLGYTAAGTWTPTSQDQAVVKFNGAGRAVQRDSLKGTANFQLVPYVDATTGNFVANPIIGNTTQLGTPFAFLS